MFEKLRRQTQLSAFRHQRRPPARIGYTAKPRKFSARRAPSTPRPDEICRLAAYLKSLKAILKVL